MSTQSSSSLYLSAHQSHTLNVMLSSPKFAVLILAGGLGHDVSFPQVCSAAITVVPSRYNVIVEPDCCHSLLAHYVSWLMHIHRCGKNPESGLFCRNSCSSQSWNRDCKKSSTFSTFTVGGSHISPSVA